MELICIIHLLGGRSPLSKAPIAITVANGYAICDDDQCLTAAMAGDTRQVLAAARELGS